MLGLVFTPMLAAILLLTSPVGAHPARADPQRFAGEVAALGAKRAKPGGIVFTGSSSICRWTSLRADFRGLPVRNHGLGGSGANDLLAFFEPLIGRHQPRLVVLYTGSNDLAAGLSVDEAFADYRAVLERIYARLPDARVIVNSVKITPSRAAQVPQVNELNRRLRKWTSNKHWARYVDATGYLADANGQPRPEYFMADRLHLNAHGYAAWRAVLEPVVREEWAGAPSAIPARTRAAPEQATRAAEVPRPRRRFHRW